MLIPRRGRARRRHHPVALAVAGLILALLALSYGIGLTRDTIALDDGSTSGVVRGTFASCGGRSTTPLVRSVVRHSQWQVTPAKLCRGPATVTVTLSNGTVTSCTAFNVAPGHDWEIALTDSGCNGFKQTTLPALP